VFDLLLNRWQAGRSAERRYKELAKAWRRRMFGRRFNLYFWTVYVLLVVLVAGQHPGGHVSLFIGFGFGAAAATWLLLPDALMPASIFNWQRGAWAEQNTESELKRLKRAGWTVRHDVRWGDKWNHDHVVAGPAVYVLNSKNMKESEVEVEGSALRVTQIDSRDAYLADRWGETVRAEARTLKAQLAETLSFPVHVNPVVVIWGRFDVGLTYIGDVCFVRGESLAEWLQSRPVDLPDPIKRAAVARAVAELASA
jgi:hypothetical protein